MESFTHNFNDDTTLVVKRSEIKPGRFIVSVSTREFFVSGPELEQLGYSIWEMLKGDSDGQESEGGEPSLSQGDDKESIKDLLSATD